MPFQMPQINDNIGNALANIGQIRQQRTQNALAERQFGLQEAEGRRQQQQFDTEQAAAQRAQLIDTTKNVLGALARVPQAQRQAAFAQLATELPPEFAQRMAGNPDAFTDQNIALALNRFGTLTPDQIFGDARRETQAKTAPKAVVTYGADGRPVERYVDTFSDEAQRGIVQAPGANNMLADATSRRNADVAAATARANAQLAAATSRSNAELSARTTNANVDRTARAAEAQRAAAAKAKGQSARTAATYYGQARDIFDAELRDTLSAGGPVQRVFGAARSMVDSDRRRASARFDAAVSFLRPAVKSVIRGPGEGTFTDSDQALLDSLLPDRSMSESEIQERLNNLEILLRDNGATIPQARTPGTTPGASGGWGQATVVED
jgi:hypothetical protein